MALVVYDRVQEVTATTGTGTLTLGGAVTGFQSFAVIGDGNTTYYTIVNGSQWEVGIGTYSTTGPTLARTTILSNSDGNTSPITLVGASNVFVTYPAEKSINYDANGVATIGSTLGYSDTGIVASFASNVAGYNQVVVQNKSSATNASSNFNVSNDAGTAGSNYAELGINSSTFTGSGSFNIAGASYLASASTDLVLGTYGAYNVHFVTNSNTTDAMTIFNSGGVSLGGYADPGIGTLYANNVYLGFNTITAAAGTTVLTNASAAWQNVVGTTTQSIQLPDATTLYKGFAFTITSSSTGAVTIKDNASATIDTVVTGGSAIMVLTDNSTSAGTWKAYSYIPSSYDFSASTANFGTATITNATWNGSTIGTAYGGTGLTSFGSANYALYSTSSSTLAAGTLPIEAGGTAKTTFTSNGVVYGNGTSALGVTAAGTTGQVLVGNTGSAPSWGTLSSAAVTSFQTSLSGLTPSTATTGAVTLAGTLGATSGGTGLTSYTTGDIIYASATNTLSNLADVATGNALISGGVGVAPSWGKIGLTTHVSGTLPTANGGTNLTSFTSGGAVYATSTSALTTGTLPISSGGTGQTTANAALNALLPNQGSASGQYLTSDGTNTSWGTVTQTTVSFSTTGLTPNTATSGSVVVGGTLNTSNGGTGLTTYTAGDLLYASGTSTIGKLAIGTNGYFLKSTGSAPQWADIPDQPVISSVSPTSFGGASGSSFVITGVGFSSGAVVTFVGNDNTQYAAATTTYTNATSLTATTPVAFPVSNSPYGVTVTLTTGATTTRAALITAGSAPSWTTASGSLGSFSEGAAVSVTVVATDPDGGAITYSLQSGSLPSGLSLNTSTGVISGTASAVTVDTTSSFTIRATDVGTNYTDRTFSITILDNVAPSWVTPAGSLGNVYDSSRTGVSFTVSATDTQAVTYSVFSGSLPGGLSLNTSSGVISGTASAVASNTTYNFTLRATDGFLNSDRAFSITVYAPQTLLYTASTGSSTTGTFTTSQGLSNFVVTISGGGGGGAITYCGGTRQAAGGGGGASTKSYASIAPGTPYSYSAGSGGALWNSVPIQQCEPPGGGVGGTSSFGPISATGGNGGKSGVPGSGYTVQGGTGGSGSGGDTNQTGGTGSVSTPAGGGAACALASAVGPYGTGGNGSSSAGLSGFVQIKY